MNRLEIFYENFKHEEPAEEQFAEARRNGIIKSYFLTTVSVMNARRNPDMCLWCGEICSIDHYYNNAPDYNCRCTFGEDFDGMAFLRVPKEALKPLMATDSQDQALVPCALNLYDEMREPNSCILKKDDGISDTRQVFDTMPKQSVQGNVSTSILKVGATCSNDTQSSRQDLIAETSFRSTQEVLDELPLPTFIREMAEAASILNESVPLPIIAEIHVHDEGFEQDDGLADEIHVEQEVTLRYQRKMELSTLNDLYFQDLVIICANREGFSTLSDLLFVSCLSKHITHGYNEVYDGNLYSKYSCFQVNSQPFIMSIEVRPMNYVQNVISPILYRDVDWFVGLNLSMILGVDASGTKVLGLEHGKRTFLVWWDCPFSKLNEKCVGKWCDTMIPLFKRISSLSYTNLFFKHNFDPGGKGLEMRLAEYDERVIDTLLCECTVCHEEMVLQVKVFDPGLVIINVALRILLDTNIFLVMPCKSEGIIDIISLRGHIEGSYTTFVVIISYDSSHHTKVIFLVKTCDIGISKMVAFPLNVFNLIDGAFRLKLSVGALTLEDKGDSEKVGNDMGLSLWWRRMSSLICVRNHLASNSNMLMTMTCSSLCFDPSGLQNKFCDVTLYGLLRVATCIESTSVWMFDQGGNGDLLGCTSIMSTSDSVYVVGTNTIGMMYLMFFSRHDFATIQSEKMHKSLTNHFTAGHMKQLPAFGYYIISTYSHSPVVYSHLLWHSIRNQNATILVFDLGGGEIGLKMINRIQVCQHVGSKRLIM